MEPFLKIELPGPPRGKGRPRAGIIPGYAPVQLSGRMAYRKVARVRMHADPKSREYEAHLTREATIAMLAKNHKMLTGVPVRCEILAIFDVPESWTKAEYAAAIAGEIRPICKPDWDNIAKVTDALNKVVWKDDAQIVDGRVQKFYGTRSFLHVEVYV